MFGFLDGLVLGPKAQRERKTQPVLSALFPLLVGLFIGMVAILQPSHGFSAEALFAQRVDVDMPSSSARMAQIAKDLISSSEALSPNDLDFELSPPPLQVRGLPVTFGPARVKGQFGDTRTEVLGRELKVRGVLNNLALYLEWIQIDGLIRQSAGSIQIDVRVSGTCRDIRLLSKESWVLRTSAAFGVNEQGLVLPLLTDLAAERASEQDSPSESSLEVEMDCEGPQGFQSEVEMALRSEFAQMTERQSIENRLLPLLQFELEQRFTNAFEIKAFANQSIFIQQIAARPQMEESGRMTLSLCVSSGPTEKDCAARSKRSDTEGSALVEWKDLRLKLPLGFAERLIEHSGFAQSAIERTGRQIEGFYKLVRSRWMQFFVWPDLMKFPKHTDFRWIAQLNQTLPTPVDLSCSPQGDLRVRTYAHAWLQIANEPEQSDTRRTLVRFDTWIDLAVKSGVSFSPLELAYEFDPNELKRRRVNTVIAVETLSPRIVNEMRELANEWWPEGFRVLRCSKD